MFQLKNKTILILSPEDWGDNLLSKHLYAKELSKNNRVFFLHTSPHPSQQLFIETTPLYENLTLLHLKKVVKGIFKLPSFAIDLQNQFIIKKIIKVINHPIDVVWSFDQSKFQNLQQFKAPVTIFHPVDYIEKAQPFLSRISDSANVVFSVSEKILETIQTKTSKYFINHGVDELFTQPLPETIRPDFINPEKVNVGYIGNLQIKLMDWNALTESVKSNPDINFVFIGPDQTSNIGGNKKFNQLDLIKTLPNTYFTGSLSKPNLRKVLSFFDAFIISYDHKNFPIHVSNSHKILELLSTGKVIVSNLIDNYKDSSLLEIVTDNQLLPQKLTEVTQHLEQYNSPEKQKARIDYALDNTYIKQIERIESILHS